MLSQQQPYSQIHSSIWSTMKVMMCQSHNPLHTLFFSCIGTLPSWISSCSMILVSPQATLAANLHQPPKLSSAHNVTPGKMPPLRFLLKESTALRIGNHGSSANSSSVCAHSFVFFRNHGRPYTTKAKEMLQLLIIKRFLCHFSMQVGGFDDAAHEICRHHHFPKIQLRGPLVQWMV